MDCSVKKIGCVEVDNWQASGIDAIDSNSRDLLAHV